MNTVAIALRIPCEEFTPDDVSELRWQSSAWSLEFDPALVQKVVDTAARWPGDLPAFGRYCELGALLVAR